MRATESPRPLLAAAAIAAIAACNHPSNLPPPAPSVTALPATGAPARAASSAPDSVVGLYTRACDGGSGLGCNNLGLVYFEGRQGEKTDATRALRLFQRACDLGEAAGCLNLGYGLLTDGRSAHDEVRAIGALTKACDASLWTACVMLGNLFLSTESEDLPRAFAIFDRACKAGDQANCGNLGVMYYEGKGVPKDAKRAATLFEGACAAGQEVGCTWLANLVMKGDGAPRDVDRARSLYAKGCTDRFPIGCFAFGAVSVRGDLGDEYVAPGVGVLRRACEHGHAEACAFLAKHLEDHESGESNEDTR